MAAVRASLVPRHSVRQIHPPRIQFLQMPSNSHAEGDESLEQGPSFPKRHNTGHVESMCQRDMRIVPRYEGCLAQAPPNLQGRLRNMGG